MRQSVFILFLHIVSVSFGQLMLKPIHSTPNSDLSQARTAKQNTLPFWDDFSVTPDGSPDATRIWGTDTTRQWNGSLSKGVFVNSTLAINPPSYKVITFDGLDANGQIYSDGYGLVDELYSDTLDLSGFTEANDIYISFYWQAGGNVEIPEEKDSIRLEFYNKSIGDWERFWSKNGSEITSTTIFQQEYFKLEQKFIHDSAMFRFQAFGDQDGPFDAWHLDWIYINANRSNDRLFYLDRGLTGQLTSPFSPYQSMPTHQLKAKYDPLIGNQTIQTFNLDDRIQPAELILTLKNASDGSLFDSMLVESVNPQLGNSDPRFITNTLDFKFENIDLSSIPLSDSLSIESTMYVAESDDDNIPGTNINLRINDTIRTQYLLHNYYAYDDGTAEYAAGLNQQDDQLAVQFWVNEQDTLTQVDFYFPNIDPDSNGENLVLRIYDSLTALLPRHAETITVNTAQATNQFTSYVLSRPVIVSDTFFITYEQNVNQYISVGLDRSNEEASKYIFQNISGEWERNTRIEGALMIRPVFKNVRDFTLNNIEEPAPLVTIYPNPTNGKIQISGTYQTVELRNLSGQLLVKEVRKEKHDFSEFPRGLYLLFISNGSTIQTEKIILE